MTATRLPPGPRRPLVGSLVAPGRDPLALFTRLARTYGDIVRLRTLGEEMFLVSHPDLVKDVLVTGSRFFRKSRGLERAKKLLGEGLLTSEGASHLRQRRLIQPAFHRERIAAYGEAMAAIAERRQSHWRDGATLDLSTEMMRLTLAIVARTLFDVDVERQADDIGVALTEVLESFWLLLLPFADFVELLPVPAIRRAQRARARLDRLIYDLIDARRRAPGDRGDLLSMLLAASDDEAGGMSDRQVRDEAMTLLLAGHETTANALAWTWWLLGQSPEDERRLHEEVDRVLGGRLPAPADAPALAWTERVVTESMRLYPPAWMVGRRAVEPYRLGDYRLPARSIVVMSQWVVHRDPRFFDRPDRFEPARWTPAFRAALPPFAYFPFGGGPRRCIGEPFAWMELVLLVATMARRWRFVASPGDTVTTQPLVTLRARNGIKMTARRR